VSEGIQFPETPAKAAEQLADRYTALWHEPASICEGTTIRSVSVSWTIRNAGPHEIWVGVGSLARRARKQRHSASGCGTAAREGTVTQLRSRRSVDVVDPLDPLRVWLNIGQIEVDHDRLLPGAHDDA
jgi:hypothetical protein